MGQALNPNYRLYHPKWHRQRMPIFWWLRRFNYTRFITRELTSVAVGYSAALLMVQLWYLSQGPEAYRRFTDWLAQGPVLVLHVVVLVVALYHSVTWLNLAPRAMVVRLGGRRVPDAMILLGHYVAWIGCSVLVVLLVVRA